MNLEYLITEVKKMVNMKVEDFEVVASHFDEVILKKNEIWEKEGRISEFMGFVNKGILRQYIIKDGLEYTTNFFMEHEFVGNYISYQTQTPSSMITEAIEPCELIVVPFSKFESFYETFPDTRKAADFIGDQKLLDIQKRNSALLINTPEERYEMLLDQKPQLLNKVPQYLIAQYLGIRPESLSRIRKRRIS